MRVGLTYNLKRGEPEEGQEPPSTSREAQAEWDEQETVDAVHAALAERHEVIPIDAADDAFNALRESRPDIVFNMAEGTFGPCREGHIPSILEYLNIPYTASDPLTLNICLDKSRAKEILAYHSLPTPRFRVVAGGDFSSNGLRYPLLVKPLFEGSSIGIRNDSLVQTYQQLLARVEWVSERFRQPALVEEFLPGREFTVAILGNGEGARVLPIVEIRFDSLPAGMNPIYSYEAKWIWDQSSHPLQIFDCPARIDGQTRAEMERLCLHAYRILRCRDWCRIDVRLDAAGCPHILELNPLPGILPRPEDNSCFPKAARAAGMSYSQLIHNVLDAACMRYGIH
ncbi:MAG: D-alanine--D-alanine ligase [Acidobacteria bacterium]|nr:D-alanine--D-alanine ligase [Acidobacteriota bacterium]